jgi:hypothetical protein
MFRFPFRFPPFDRASDLGGEARAPWDWAEASKDRSELRVQEVSRDQFRSDWAACGE